MIRMYMAQKNSALECSRFRVFFKTTSKVVFFEIVFIFSVKNDKPEIANTLFHRYHCIFAMQNISVYFVAFDTPKKTLYPSECRVLHIRLFTFYCTVFRLCCIFPKLCIRKCGVSKHRFYRTDSKR